MIDKSVGTAENPQISSGRVFISYRRQDSAYPAGWLYDRLVERLGSGQVFKDVDSIELGDDFVQRIAAAVGSCDILLALIGPQWLNIRDSGGSRRIDGSEDFVRLEIEAAVSRNVLLIPILVEGARCHAAISFLKVFLQFRGGRLSNSARTVSGQTRVNCWM